MTFRPRQNGNVISRTSFNCNALFHRYALFAWCHVWSLFFTMPAFLLNKATMSGMAIWVVEFSRENYKVRQIFGKKATLYSLGLSNCWFGLDTRVIIKISTHPCYSRHCTDWFSQAKNAFFVFLGHFWAYVGQPQQLSHINALCINHPY